MLYKLTKSQSLALGTKNGSEIVCSLFLFHKKEWYVRACVCVCVCIKYVYVYIICICVYVYMSIYIFLRSGKY